MFVAIGCGCGAEPKEYFFLGMVVVMVLAVVVVISCADEWCVCVNINGEALAYRPALLVYRSLNQTIGTIDGI